MDIFDSSLRWYELASYYYRPLIETGDFSNEKTFKDKPTLAVGDLTLRRFSERDAQRMIEIISIPEVVFLTGSECSSEDINKPNIILTYLIMNR